MLNSYFVANIIRATLVAIVVGGLIVVGFQCHDAVARSLGQSVGVTPRSPRRRTRKVRSGSRTWCRYCSSWQTSGTDCATVAEFPYAAASGRLSALLSSVTEHLRRLQKDGIDMGYMLPTVNECLEHIDESCLDAPLWEYRR